MKTYRKIDRMDFTEIYYYLGKLSIGADVRQLVIIKLIMEKLDKALYDK